MQDGESAARLPGIPDVETAPVSDQEEATDQSFDWVGLISVVLLSVTAIVNAWARLPTGSLFGHWRVQLSTCMPWVPERVDGPGNAPDLSLS